MKVQLRQYANGVVVKIPNRRIVLVQEPTGADTFMLQIKNSQVTAKGRPVEPGSDMDIHTMPAAYHVDRDRVGTLTLNLSVEACYALLSGLNDVLGRLAPEHE